MKVSLKFLIDLAHNSIQQKNTLKFFLFILQSKYGSEREKPKKWVHVYNIKREGKLVAVADEINEWSASI